MRRGLTGTVSKEYGSFRDVVGMDFLISYTQDIFSVSHKNLLNVPKLQSLITLFFWNELYDNKVMRLM